MAPVILDLKEMSSAESYGVRESRKSTPTGEAGCKSRWLAVTPYVTPREVIIMLLLAAVVIMTATRPSTTGIASRRGTGSSTLNSWHSELDRWRNSKNKFPNKVVRRYVDTRFRRHDKPGREVHHRTSRQAVSMSIADCDPLATGAPLRRALNGLGVTSRNECTAFELQPAAFQLTLDVCGLAAFMQVHIGAVEAQMSNTGSNDTDPRLQYAQVVMDGISEFRTNTCQAILTTGDSSSVTLRELNDNNFAIATAFDLVGKVLPVNLMQQHSSIEVLLADVGIRLASFDTLITYNELLGVHLVESFLLPSLNSCTLAFPACDENNQARIAFDPNSQVCRTVLTWRPVLYPQMHPDTTPVFHNTAMQIALEQCTVPGLDSSTRSLACFSEPSTNVTAMKSVAGGDGGDCDGVPVYNCPEPYQWTDNPAHWRREFGQLANQLNSTLSNSQREFAACAFPCGQKCRAEGYSDATTSALLTAQSISTWIALVFTLLALVGSVITRKVMFRYPNRLLVFLNVSYLVFLISYLPAATVDVVPLLCHSDRTLRTSDYSDSILCMFTFITNYGGGVLFQTISIYVAITWVRMALSLSKVTVSQGADSTQALMDAGAFVCGAAFAATGIAVILSKGDGVTIIVQNGICAVSANYSLGAVEIPYAIASILQGILLLIGIFQVVRLRRFSRKTRRRSSLRGNRNKAEESLNRIIRTLLFYVIIMIVNGVAWLLAAAASRIGGFDPTKLFKDEFQILVCTLVTCGTGDCTPGKTPTYIIASEVVFTILIGLSGTIYASWIFQKSIWRAAGRRAPTSIAMSTVATRVSIVSMRAASLRQKSNGSLEFPPSTSSSPHPPFRRSSSGNSVSKTMGSPQLTHTASVEEEERSISPVIVSRSGSSVVAFKESL